MWPANLKPDLLSYLARTDKSQIAHDILTWRQSRQVSAVGGVYYAATLNLGEDAFLNYCLGTKNKEVREIAAAVQRQTAFIDKMERHLWIRSPALEGTLRRAIDRYSKFLKLLKLYPGNVLVPTLDIDLVWHTHQCSASRYQADTQTIADRFIDHDDKLGKPVLGGGMEKTKQLFRIRFGQEYFLCNCWYCEAVLSEVEKLDQNRATQAQLDAIAQRVSLNVAYHRAVELARRAGKPLPVRDARPL
jgi:hypothetical protein